MIRVLLVDDSPIAIAVLKRMLSKSLEIVIAGIAQNGLEALHLIPQVKPDVICTDLHMPVMDGLEFTREVMMRHPLPVLLVSISGLEGSRSAFKALEAGAIDIFLKPEGKNDLDYEKQAAELIMKIRIISKVHVFRKNKSYNASADTDKKINSELPQPAGAMRIIVIGSSTGGPPALQTILTDFPPDFPLPIICIQHISEGFLQGLISWLSSLCKMKIAIAESRVFPQAGTVYFPPENMHLQFDDAGRFVVSSDLPVDGHRPSITVTMNAAAHYYGNAVLGVLLTGMGKDGAEGLLTIKKAGGFTIAQDEKSSIVFGMPKHAIELGAAGLIVSLDEIGHFIFHSALQSIHRK